MKDPATVGRSEEAFARDILSRVHDASRALCDLCDEANQAGMTLQFDGMGRPMNSPRTQIINPRIIKQVAP